MPVMACVDDARYASTMPQVRGEPRLLAWLERAQLQQRRKGEQAFTHARERSRGAHTPNTAAAVGLQKLFFCFPAVCVLCLLSV